MSDSSRDWVGQRGLSLAGATFAAALAVRLALVFTLPPYQAPDERAHVRYVEYVVRQKALPAQPRQAPTEALRFWPQYYQPPLAYLLFAPTWAAARAVGAPEDTAVRALRVQNAVYGAIAAALVAGFVARLTPRGDPRRLAAAAVAALLPGLAASGAAVNNDGLANLLASALWLPLVAARSRRAAASAAGLVLGAGCCAKLTVLPLAPLLFLVPWLERRQDPIGALRCGALAAAAAAVVFAPVALRNIWVYGHPLAIGAGSFELSALADSVRPEALAALSEPRPLRVLQRFVGGFGIYGQLRFVPAEVTWGALALVAGVGWLARGGVRWRDGLERHAPALALALGLAVAGLLFFSVRYYGGWKGRYLQPALLPIAVLLASGWCRMAPARVARLLFAWIALALLLLDVALVLAVGRFFAATPPSRWPFPAFL